MPRKGAKKKRAQEKREDEQKASEEWHLQMMLTSDKRFVCPGCRERFSVYDDNAVTCACGQMYCSACSRIDSYGRPWGKDCRDGLIESERQLVAEKRALNSLANYMQEILTAMYRSS